MKKILLTTAAAAIFGLSSISGQVAVIYDGGTVTVDVSQSGGGSTYASDDVVGNPAGSLSFSGPNGAAVTFAPTDTSFFLTPNDVDFSGAGAVVSFDYLIPSGSTAVDVGDFRLKLFNPGTNIVSTAIDLTGPISLTASGNWETASFTFGAFANLWGLDPDTPQQFYIQVKAGANGLNANIDNIRVSLVGGVESVTFWADSPADESGWRYSGMGYDEPGIGWIWDGYWPWVYTTGIKGVGQWIHVYDLSADRNGFYAYVIDGSYWIYGVSGWGYYYSFESGNEGWMAFAL